MAQEEQADSDGREKQHLVRMSRGYFPQQQVVHTQGNPSEMKGETTALTAYLQWQFTQKRACSQEKLWETGKALTVVETTSIVVVGGTGRTWHA